MSQSDYWKDKPRLFDFRAVSLLVPGIASAIGFFCFAVLAFSFTELTSMGTQWRKGLVIVGAIAVAFGGEIGTLATAVEVHRKERNGTAQRGDRIALIISKAATAGELVIAFATLLGTKARWGPLVQEWGMILLGLLAMLDAYAGFQEFGYYMGEYDERVRQWQQERDEEIERQRQKQERREDRRDNLALRLELDEMKRAAVGSEPANSQLEPALSYPCPLCGKTFTTQAGCNAHQRVHVSRSNGHEPVEQPAEVAP